MEQMSMLVIIGYLSQILLGFFMILAGLGKLPKKYQVEIDKLGFLSRKLRVVFGSIWMFFNIIQFVGYLLK